MLLRAFLTHSIAYGLPWRISSFLDILSPFLFLGHPRSILIMHSHEFLLTLLGFPGPIVISFTFGVHRLSINLLLTYFITSGLLWPIIAFHTAHKFITFFFWAPLGPLAFFEAHLLFFRPMIHYSCHSSFMVFFPIY